MREIQKGIKVNRKGSIRLPLDLTQIKALFGKTSFKEEFEDFDKFYM